MENFNYKDLKIYFLMNTTGCCIFSINYKKYTKKININKNDLQHFNIDENLITFIVFKEIITDIEFHISIQYNNEKDISSIDLMAFGEGVPNIENSCESGDYYKNKVIKELVQGNIKNKLNNF